MYLVHMLYHSNGVITEFVCSFHSQIEHVDGVGPIRWGFSGFVGGKLEYGTLGLGLLALLI